MSDVTPTLQDGHTSPAKPARKGKSDADIVSAACKRLDIAIAFWSPTRLNEVEDLKFAAGNSDNNYQWPDYATATRGQGSDGTAARPTLTVNKLPQHIKQITNDQLQNLPSVDVIPTNDDAAEEMAEVYEDVIRHIEMTSVAKIAYGQACDNQVTFGEGYIRVITEYDGEMSFDQIIKILNVRNSFCYYIDPTIQRPCGEDMDWALITEDVTHDEYELKYPDATPVSSIEQSGVGDQSLRMWVNSETIRIAEYFYFDHWTEKLWLFRDGKTAFEGTPEFEVFSKALGEPIKSRNVQRKAVKWVKTNGYEILEKRDWPGKYIPVVRVIGNEFEIEGQVFLSGIVRNAKDPQRMYNYHCSQEVEMLALAPKAPFIGAAGQFEGFESDWKTANTKNHPYLQYNPIVDEQSGQMLPPPQRVQPPMVQQGIISAKQAASEDIKDATGQYNASLGQQSNERSGKAILARQHEGDVSTFHYQNNLSLAVQMVGCILVDLIPKIYDTERIAKIRGEDGKSKSVAFNPDQKAAVVDEVHPDNPDLIIRKIFNPNVGKYDVAVVAGPGYATKRQAALEAMSEILQAHPELFSSIGDLVVKEMDWPGHTVIAKRLAKMVPPQLMDDEDNPGLKQAQQQIQQLTQEIEQLHGMLTNAQKSFEAREVAVKEAKVHVEMYDAETRRIAATVNPAPMSEQQVQDVALGVVHAAMGMEGGLPPGGPQQPQEGPPPMDQNKLLQEFSKHALQGQQHAQDSQMQAAQHAHEADMQANAPQPAQGAQ